jgi:4-hydroxy-3-polyprenylbenzoate decarboxylase
MRRIVVGISGASGSIYGVRLLEALRPMEDVETHLVLTCGAVRTLELETDRTRSEVEALADEVYDVEDIAAPIASGSYPVEAMVVVPCSIKTLSAISSSYADNLLTRAADVALKEGRKLVLCVRETPLHKGHIKLMLAAAELGAAIVPPMVALYHKPATVDEVIDHGVGRILDTLNIMHQLYKRWGSAS